MRKIKMRTLKKNENLGMGRSMETESESTFGSASSFHSFRIRNIPGRGTVFNLPETRQGYGINITTSELSIKFF